MFVEIKRDGEALTITEPWRRVLLDAANYIEQHGWCQGAYRGGSAVCPIRAIVTVDPFHEHGATLRMRKYVGGHVEAWNDAPGRTQDEVVGALRACARGG